MDDILYPIIEHYIGIKVAGVQREDDIVQFVTSIGQEGKIERNSTGDWDLSVEQEKVAEIEDILFSIFCESRKQPPIDRYYKRLLKLKKRGLNYRSKVLVEQLILSVEYLLLNSDVKLKNPLNIGPFYIFNFNNRKEIIVLN